MSGNYSGHYEQFKSVFLVYPDARNPMCQQIYTPFNKLELDILTPEKLASMHTTFNQH